VTELVGDGIVLRELEPGDVSERYAAWMNDVEVTRYLETEAGDHSVASLRAYVEQVEADPTSHLFAIRERAGDRHIGNIKIGPVEAIHGRADIGLVIGERDTWGRGHATEAIALVSAWAFAELGVHKLTAGAYEPNVGSILAFERAGFHVEARRRGHAVVDGHRIDAVLLARFHDGSPSSG
jgi:RimJ/RimL family protein N-acetyltransferase